MFSNSPGINIDSIFPQNMYSICFSVFLYKIMHYKYDFIILSATLIKINYIVGVILILTSIIYIFNNILYIILTCHDLPSSAILLLLVQ